VVILRAVLKPEIVEEKLELAALQKIADADPDREEDAEPIKTDKGNEFFDLYANEDNDNIMVNYNFYIADRGEEVSIDLEITDRVHFNVNNAKFLDDVTDASLDETYFYTLDQLIDLRAPEAQHIK